MELWFDSGVRFSHIINLSYIHTCTTRAHLFEPYMTNALSFVRIFIHPTNASK